MWLKVFFSDKVIVKSSSDFSRFSTPSNIEVGTGGVYDGNGSIGINLVLSIASGLIPV